jgi:hypothetical protein
VLGLACVLGYRDSMIERADDNASRVCRLCVESMGLMIDPAKRTTANRPLDGYWYRSTERNKCCSVCKRHLPPSTHQEALEDKSFHATRTAYLMVDPRSVKRRHKKGVRK